jgi:hypothetical protein
VACFDKNRVSKGLLAIAKEMGVVEQDVKTCEIRLPDLRARMLGHLAFTENTRLEQLAAEFGVKIIFLPKYHCEISPVEGVWRHEKDFTRKFNDQKFAGFFSLIQKSRQYYLDGKFNLKIWSRFWEALDMYDSGKSYKDVMQTLFGARRTGTNVFHTRI